MKKIYKNPEMQVVKLNTEIQMLAGSPGVGGEYQSGTPEAPRFEFDEEGLF